MHGPHLVIIRQLLAWGDVAFGVDDDVLVALNSDDFGVAVGFTRVIDEACQSPLHSRWSSAVSRGQLLSALEKRPA